MRQRPTEAVVLLRRSTFDRITIEIASKQTEEMMKRRKMKLKTSLKKKNLRQFKKMTLKLKINHQ